MFVILFVSLVTLFVFYYFYRKNSFTYWKKRGVPQASEVHWLFGHSKDLITGNFHFGERSIKLYNEFPDSPFLGLYNFGKPYIMIKDPDYIKAILNTDFNSFSENEFKIDANDDFLVGYNPFFLSGNKWKVSRSHATPLTTLAKLKHYYPGIMRVSDEMVKYIKNESSKSGFAELEGRALGGKFTTDSVANGVFGIQNNTFEDEKSFFAEITRNIFASDFINNMKLFLTIVFPKLTNFIGVRFASKVNESVILSLIRKVMSERAVTKEVRNDIFQQMITYKENDKIGAFTEKYIASHLFSFIVDGFETSSDALSFTLFEIAWQTNVQDRLRNEINEMIKESEGELTLDQIEKCKYLDMVVSESLRMYPPITAFSKVSTTKYTFNSKTPLTLDKGIPANIPIYAIHMDEKYFPDPKKFDPERFTDEAIAKRHKFVYLPFGEGPRKCVGQRFGLLQIKIAIIALVKNFKLSPSPKSKYPVQFDPQDFLSRPLNGAWIQLKPLN